MYSRQSAPRQQPWQIPKNYGGSTFSRTVSEQYGQEEHESGSAEQETERPVSADRDRSESNKSTPFSPSRKGGIGFEELLILGLVLLVSQSDEGKGNNDLAFLLLLLLFIQ